MKLSIGVLAFGSWSRCLFIQCCFFFRPSCLEQLPTDWLINWLFGWLIDCAPSKDPEEVLGVHSFTPRPWYNYFMVNIEIVCLRARASDMISGEPSVRACVHAKVMFGKESLPFVLGKKKSRCVLFYYLPPGSQTGTTLANHNKKEAGENCAFKWIALQSFFCLPVVACPWMHLVPLKSIKKYYSAWQVCAPKLK